MSGDDDQQSPVQTYRERRPAPALAPYLTCVWVQQVAAGSAPYTESLRLAGQAPRALLLEAEKHCRPAHDHVASYGPLLESRTMA